MMHSAVFRGQVAHRRMGPREHAFEYGMQMLYVDLEELPTLFDGRWLWSVDRKNVVTFNRSDYLGQPDMSLRDSVLDRVASELGRRPVGRVGILTQLRTLGYLFNPVSFYFCHDDEGSLDAIVAEITNTPWGERHAYVLDAKAAIAADGSYAFEFEKDFHISPFFPMQLGYVWNFVWEPDRVRISMTNREAGRAVFNASLACLREPINARSLAMTLLRFPLQPLRMHIAIYWQAARLFFKRVPVYTHPNKHNPLREAPLP